MTEYYIYSNSFTIQERHTKKGTVYDVVFRIITIDGAEKQKRLSGFQTKALAKRAHAEFVMKKCEVVTSRPTRNENTQKKKITVSEAWQEYLRYLLSYQDNKESTIYSKKKAFAFFILPYIGNTPIEKLDKTALTEWQDKVLLLRNPKTGKPYSSKYFALIRGHLNSFLTWAEEKYNIQNALTKVKKPVKRASDHKIKFWTKEDFEKFISVVDNPLYHCLFTIMFYTGRRKGEIFALSPANIHKTTILWDKSISRKLLSPGQEKTYVMTTTKEDKVQELPICKRVQDEIIAYGGGSPFFFGGEKPISPTHTARMFDRYCVAAGVEKIRIHDLRHSFASMLLSNGENYKVIADLLGDTVEQVMKTYCHIGDKDIKNAVAKLDL